MKKGGILYFGVASSVVIFDWGDFLEQSKLKMIRTFTHVVHSSGSRTLIFKIQTFLLFLSNLLWTLKKRGPASGHEFMENHNQARVNFHLSSQQSSIHSIHPQSFHSFFSLLHSCIFSVKNKARAPAGAPFSSNICFYVFFI